MIDGGNRIRNMTWDDAGGIMQQGGTVIGTARCAAFRTREGRLKAAQHLLERGIDRLVVIGGDGSLTGANIFRQEWPDLLAELVRRRPLSGTWLPSIPIWGSPASSARLTMTFTAPT